VSIRFFAKLLGCILLVGCGWGAGYCCAGQYRLRRCCLQSVSEVLRWLQDEISYRKTPLPQLYLQLKKQHPDWPAAQRLQSMPPPAALTPEERQQFTACFGGMGQGGASQECSRLAHYRKWFDTACEQAAQQERSAAALYGKLGLGTGVMAALFFL